MARTQLTPIEAARAADLAREAGVPLPIEQSAAWDRFDRAMPGRAPWMRLAYREDDAELAVVALTEYRGRGFRYLWAKHGPVWLLPEGRRPTPDQEQRFRAALVRAVRRADRGIAFVRLHAWKRAADTHELLQTMPHDRTVVVPLWGVPPAPPAKGRKGGGPRPAADGAEAVAGPLDDDALMSSFKKRGRRDLRKGLRENPLRTEDVTGLSRDDFDELYAVLVETAARDEFGIAEIDTYWTMLDALGPEHARVFVARAGDGELVAWNIVTVNDGTGVAYYGASTATGRRTSAPEQLYWFILRTLRDEGVREFDFLGIDSERAPRLAGVAEFKRKFSDEITEVAGPWDVPVRPVLYRGLVGALAAKRGALGAARSGVGRVRELIAERRTGGTDAGQGDGTDAGPDAGPGSGPVPGPDAGAQK